MSGVALDARRRSATAGTTPRPPFWLADLGGLLAGLAMLVGGALLLAALIDPAQTPPPRPAMQVRSLPPPQPETVQPLSEASRPRPTPQHALPTPALPQLALPALDQALELPAIATDPELVAWDPSAPVLPSLPAPAGDASGDRPARYLGTGAEVAHCYPRRARRRGIEGRSTVRLQIDAQGRVTAVEVLQSEPAGVFERAARRAALQLRYEPAVRDGRAVASEEEKILIWSLR